MIVSFPWQGKFYTGELKPVAGATQKSMFHLMVKGYYQGQLYRTETGWTFSNQRHGIIAELSIFFGKFVDGS
jgi:hypothetical protein